MSNIPNLCKYNFPLAWSKCWSQPFLLLGYDCSCFMNVDTQYTCFMNADKHYSCCMNADKVYSCCINVNKHY